MHTQYVETSTAKEAPDEETAKAKAQQAMMARLEQLQLTVEDLQADIATLSGATSATATAARRRNSTLGAAAAGASCPPSLTREGSSGLGMGERSETRPPSDSRARKNRGSTSVTFSELRDDAGEPSAANILTGALKAVAKDNNKTIDRQLLSTGGSTEPSATLLTDALADVSRFNKEEVDRRLSAQGGSHGRIIDALSTAAREEKAEISHAHQCMRAAASETPRGAPAVAGPEELDTETMAVMDDDPLRTAYRSGPLPQSSSQGVVSPRGDLVPSRCGISGPPQPTAAESPGGSSRSSPAHSPTDPRPHAVLYDDGPGDDDEGVEDATDLRI